MDKGRRSQYVVILGGERAAFWEAAEWEMTRMPKSKSEYDKFDELARGILTVSHTEIKSELKAEELAKKRRKTKKSFASREEA